jgi:hypothetical protein
LTRSLVFDFLNSSLATNILDVDKHLRAKACLRLTYQVTA